MTPQGRRIPDTVAVAVRSRRATLGAACLIIATASAADSATFFASASSSSVGFPGCSTGNLSGPGPISASCPRAKARAEPGSIGAFARSEVVEEGNVLVVGDRDAEARASFNDVLRFSIDSGSITIPLDILAEIDFEAQNISRSPTFPQSSFARVMTSLTDSLGFGVGTFYQFDLLPGGVTEETGQPAEIVEAVFDFNFGSLWLSGSIAVQTGCGDLGNSPAICRLEADAFSSLRLLGATVRDETGAIRDDVTITSDSGFDYLEGVEPHGATVVPLPASALLLLGGLAGLGVVGRRRPAPG